MEPCTSQRRALCVLALCFCLSAWALPADAQDANKQAAAQGLFDEAMRLFGSAEYEKACKKLEASLALMPAMGTRGKLAECYEKVGRTASAWAAYREVAVLAERAGQPRRQEVAQERAARLESSLSFLTIVVPREALLPGLRIERNGVVVSPGAFGTAIATDPGPQQIVVSATNCHSQSLQQDLANSGRETVEVPVLKALPASETKLPAKPPVVRIPDKPDESQRIYGMVSVGAGAGAILVAGILGGIAKRDYDAVLDGDLCGSDKSCTPEGVIAVNDARRVAHVGTGFLVAGTALALVGGYLWWQSPSDSEDPSVVQVTPTAGSGKLGVVVGGRF